MKTKVLLKVLFCKGLFFCVTSLFAQDNIIKKDGTEILSKVMEIGETHIKYKNFSNLDGPVYTIPISDVFMIKYEGGEKDIFNKTPEQKQNSAQQNQETGASLLNNGKALHKPGETQNQEEVSPAKKGWSVKFGVDVAPGFSVLWAHDSDVKDMAGFSLMSSVNVSFIENSSGVFFEIGAGVLSGNYSVTERNIKSEMKANIVNLDLLIGQMSSVLYYKTGARLGIVADVQARVGNMPFQPIDKESLNSVMFGMPFEIGVIAARRINIGLGWNFGFVSLFKKEYTNDIRVTPMEIYLKVGARL